MIGFFCYYRSDTAQPVANQVEIYVGNRLLGSYPLTGNRVIEVGEHNVVTIQEGSISMTEADCPDHTCIRQGRVSRPGLPIVCLPNEVVVMITENGEEKIDAMVQ